LGNLMSALIFFSTILGTFFLGIFAAYASVVSILRSMAPRRQFLSPPALAQKAQAAHAGGD
jgi:hypothetical protein